MYEKIITNTHTNKVSPPQMRPNPLPHTHTHICRFWLVLPLDSADRQPFCASPCPPHLNVCLCLTHPSLSCEAPEIQLERETDAGRLWTPSAPPQPHSADWDWIQRTLKAPIDPIDPIDSWKLRQTDCHLSWEQKSQQQSQIQNIVWYKACRVIASFLAVIFESNMLANIPLWGFLSHVVEKVCCACLSVGYQFGAQSAIRLCKTKLFVCQLTLLSWLFLTATSHIV